MSFRAKYRTLKQEYFDDGTAVPRYMYKLVPSEDSVPQTAVFSLVHDGTTKKVEAEFSEFANFVPLILTFDITPETQDPGSDITLTVTVQDPESDITSVTADLSALVNGTEDHALSQVGDTNTWESTFTLDETEPNEASHTITATATDDNGATDTETDDFNTSA